MSGKIREMDMCEGPIFSKLIVFSIPVILSGVLQLLFNAADVVVVGRFAGQQSLAAVGSTGALVSLLVNLFMGLSVGVNSLVARYYGSGDIKGIFRSVHTAVSLSLISGIFVMIVGFAFAKPMLILMDTPDDVLELAVLYLRIYYLGMPFNMFYNFGSAILRAVGDTRRPLYFLTIAGVVNVFLNLFFVIVLKMDVAGVAIATVVSQVVSAFLLLLCLIHNEGTVKLVLKEVKIYSTEFRQMLRIGVPAGIQSSIFATSNMLIQSSINYFGSTVMAASAASSNIEGFVYMIMNAFYHTTLSFVGQNFGRHDFKRIKKIIAESLLTVTVLGIVAGYSAIFFGKELISIYNTEPEVIAKGLERLTLVCSIYFLCGVMEVLVSALRGLGQSLIPMISSIVGVCGVRLIWILTVFPKYRDCGFTRILGIDFTAMQVLMLSWPISYIVTVTIHTTMLIIILRMFRRREESIENIKITRV